MEDDIIQKINKASSAFAEWKIVSLNRRWRLLHSLCRQIYENKSILLRVLKEESRQTEAFSYMDIYGGMLFFSRGVYLCARQLVNYKRYIYRRFRRRAYVSYEPLGTIGVILPYNAPMYLSIQHAIQTLILGNTLLLKFSEKTPILCGHFERIIKSSQLPSGVIMTACAGREISEAIVDSDKIKKVILYGNVLTGESVLKRASAKIKPVVCELSGNEAAIVLSDCDVAKTVRRLIYGAFNNAGQVCTSVRRIFVDRVIYGEFTRRFVEEIRKLHLSFRKELEYSVNHNFFRELVSSLHSKDKYILWGDINKYEPIVFSNLPPEADIIKQALLYPYVCINTFSTEKEAVSLANSSDYGLSASVWSKDIKRASAIAEKIAVSKVSVNETQVFHPLLPHGGTKKSGFGKTTGLEGMRSCMQLKVYTVDEGGKRVLDYYPYVHYNISILENIAAVRFGMRLLYKVKAFYNIICILLRIKKK